MTEINKSSDQKETIAFLQVGPGIGPITNNNFRFSEALHRRGYLVDMVGTSVSPDVVRSAPKFVNIVNLCAPYPHKYITPLAKYLRKSKPKAIFCSGPTTHIACGLASIISGYKGHIVFRSHIYTSLYLKERNWVNRTILLYLLKIVKNLCHFNVAVSRAAADDLAKCLGIEGDRVGVLYNPSVDDRLLSLANENINHRWFASKDRPVIVTAARLHNQKAIDVLLKAFQKVVKERNVRLIILGDGPLKSDLLMLSRELGIQDHVDFCGHVYNPYSFMKQADLFVLSTKYEGSPNVVTEALAVGCPVVSTDAPSGPRELLEGGEFGRLVPVGDVEALARAVIQSLSEDVDRERLKERGKEFHVENLVDDLLYFAGAYSASSVAKLPRSRSAY